MAPILSRLSNAWIAVALLAGLLAGCATQTLRGTGDLGVIIERASGRVQIVDTTHHRKLAEVDGFGDLSHASLVYSRDGRYAYVFGRDGGLTKLDLLRARIDRRIVQAGNSIGGAISQDGKIIAAANYEPGGVRLFDADTLEPLSEIPAVYGPANQRSRVVGLEDGTGNRFVVSLFDGGEIWLIDASNPRAPVVTKLPGIGQQPYDALISEDGRHYIAGLFGEDGLVLLDLWQREPKPVRILPGYGKNDPKLPVYKMPHLEGWAMTEDYAFLPAVGRHEVLVVDRRTWKEAGRIAVAGQPVFVMARPDGRHVWVNFALPNNDTLQVIDTASLSVIQTLKPGKGVLHMEFSARGEEVWASVRDDDKVVVYDTETLRPIAELPAAKPSGIFFTWRAHRIGL